MFQGAVGLALILRARPVTATEFRHSTSPTHKLARACVKSCAISYSSHCGHLYDSLLNICITTGFCCFCVMSNRHKWIRSTYCPGFFHVLATLFNEREHTAVCNLPVSTLSLHISIRWYLPRFGNLASAPIIFCTRGRLCSDTVATYSMDPFIQKHP